MKVSKIIIICLSLLVFSCSSANNLTNTMPKWWNTPINTDEVYSCFVSEYIDAERIAQLSLRQYDNLTNTVKAMAKEEMKNFFNVSNIPNDVMTIGMEDIVIQEDKNLYLARVDVLYSNLYKLNPDLNAQVSVGEELAGEYYNKAIKFYEEYKDSKAVKNMFIASVIAYKSKITRGKYYYKNLVNIAINMLKKIELTCSEPDEKMENIITVKRNSNIIKEGISDATISVNIKDVDTNLIHKFSYLSDKKGNAYIKRNYYLNSNNVNINYSLDLEIESEFFNPYQYTEDFTEFYKISNEKQINLDFKQDKLELSISVGSLFQDGSKTIFPSSDFQKIITANNDKYRNIHFYNLPYEMNYSEAQEYLWNNKSVKNDDYMFISLVNIDNEKFINEEIYTLHSFFDLYIYDIKKKKVVKTLNDLECIGMGEDKFTAQDNLITNQLTLVKSYMLEYLGRIF